MENYKKTGDDILKEWLDFTEENLGALTCKEDKEHFIYFEEISKDILNNVSGNNIEYKKSQIITLWIYVCIIGFRSTIGMFFGNGIKLICFEK